MNRRFQLQQYAEVFPIQTQERVYIELIKGWGLCAGEFLPKGTFVMQYIGEIYSVDSEIGMKKLDYYKVTIITLE